MRWKINSPIASSFDTKYFSGTNLKLTDLNSIKQVRFHSCMYAIINKINLWRQSWGCDIVGEIIVLKWFEIQEVLYKHQKWMKTRPRLNALEMYSTGYDNKNGIPTKTYRREMQSIRDKGRYFLSIWPSSRFPNNIEHINSYYLFHVKWQYLNT